MKKIIGFFICIALVISACSREPIVGGDSDEHGCIGSAGYTWCEEKGKCLRIWEEPCGQMTLEQAAAKAQGSDCLKQGSLTQSAIYNENSRTWWIDLDMKPEFRKEGCSPACVVYDNGTVEINWRCTGLLQ